MHGFIGKVISTCNTYCTTTDDLTKTRDDIHCGIDPRWETCNRTFKGKYIYYTEGGGGG